MDDFNVISDMNFLVEKKVIPIFAANSLLILEEQIGVA